MKRPGTLRNLLTLSDNSHIYIDAVVVDKIKADEGYFTVKETYYTETRIVVLTPPSPLLRRGQLLDIEGDKTTLSNGCVALTNVTVYGYLSKENGVLLTHGGPVTKGIIRKTPWAYMTDITVRPAITSPLSDEPNDSPAEQPSYYPTIADVIEGDSAAAQESSSSAQRMSIESLYDGIPDLNGLPDGSLVELQCKRITGVGTEQINGTTYHYIDIAEDLPATDTIRCYYSGTPTVTTADRINRITGQIRYIDTVEVICVDDGPSYNPQTLEGKIQAVTAGTIGWVKSFADGTVLPSSLSDKVVSRAYPSIGYFYIQEPMRESGIRVYSQSMAQNVQPGNIVTVSGTISSQDGERMLTPGTITITGTTDQPRPLGLNNKVLGGDSFNTTRLAYQDHPRCRM
jgi:hypothetical protein